MRSPSLPPARASHAAGVCHGAAGSGASMLLFGGVGGAGDSYFNDVWLLHAGPDAERSLAVDEASWSRVPTRSSSAHSYHPFFLQAGIGFRFIMQRLS